jgi:hypothetical protein
MAHTFDISAFTAETTANPATVAITAGAGSTLVVLCICDSSGTSTSFKPRVGGDPTYGGVAMTKVHDCSVVGNGGETWIEMWYIVNNAAGANTISVPNTSGVLQLHAASFKAGTGFTSTIDTSVKRSQAAGANPGVNISPTDYGTVAVGFLGSGRAVAPSAVTGVRIVSQLVTSHSGTSQYRLLATPQSSSIGWTVATDDQAMIAATWREHPLPNLILKVAGDASTQISKISGLAYSSVHSVCKIGGSSATAPSK